MNIVLKPALPHSSEVVVAEWPFIIGRHHARLALSADGPETARLSRRHACIFHEAGVPYLVDLRSRYGTRLNGDRVGATPVRIRHGDEISFAGCFDYTVALAADDGEVEPRGGRAPRQVLDPPPDIQRPRARNGRRPAFESIDVGHDGAKQDIEHARAATSGTDRNGRRSRPRLIAFRVLAAGLALLGLSVPFGAYTTGSGEGRGSVSADESPGVDFRAGLEELKAKLDKSDRELQRQGRKIARLQREAALRQPDIDGTDRQAGAAPAQRSPAEAPPAELPVLPRASFGTYHALVIGSDTYRYLPRLDTAVSDAQAVAELLAKRYGFETTVLVNANRYQILSNLNSLRERLTDRDNLVIYYAGHGEIDEINHRGQWLPVDAELKSTANWISNAEVTDILNAMTAKHVLLIADSCYSGALTRASAGRRIAGGLSDRQRHTWIRIMTDRRSRIALTSGGVEPVVDAGDGRHSVFAKALLEALGSNARILDGQSLFAEISAQVTYAASHYEITQVPEYAPIKYAGHDGGEFFFVPTVLEDGAELPAVAEEKP